MSPHELSTLSDWGRMSVANKRAVSRMKGIVGLQDQRTIPIGWKLALLHYLALFNMVNS